MTLPYAILTSLLERPATGSQLASRFDRSIGHFWTATHQQIYRELARLEGDGLIEPEPGSRARGRNRVYRVRDAGRAALRDWVARPDPAPALRDSLMVRLRAEAVAGPTALDAQISARLTQHRAKLAQYRDIAAQDFPNPPQDRAGAIYRLILDAGIRHESHWIEILEQALAVLDADTAPGSARPSNARHGGQADTPP